MTSGLRHEHLQKLHQSKHWDCLMIVKIVIILAPHEKSFNISREKHYGARLPNMKRLLNRRPEMKVEGHNEKLFSVREYRFFVSIRLSEESQ